jgi:excisionase family DNA binding protein
MQTAAVRTRGPLLYDIAGAGQVLSLGRSKIYELLKSGQLESIVIGRRRLIPADALATFVEEQRSRV